MSKISQEIVTIKFSTVLDNSVTPSYVDANTIQAAISNVSTTLFGFNTIVEVVSTSNVTIDGKTVIVTGGSYTGQIATLTYASQVTAPFQPGQTIVVANVTPSGYNGTFSVLTCNTTAVTYASNVSSAITGVGTITATS